MGIICIVALVCINKKAVHNGTAPVANVDKKEFTSDASVPTTTQNISEQNTVHEHAPLIYDEQGRTYLYKSYQDFLYQNDPSLCGTILPAPTSTEEIVYANAKKGIALTIPYNKKWGNEKYVFPAYDEVLASEEVATESVVESVSFGPGDVSSGGGGCGISRQYRIDFQPAQSIEQVKNEYTDTIFSGWEEKEKIKDHTLSINGLPVVTYTFPNPFCNNEEVWAVVVGKKSNYLFRGNNYAPRGACTTSAELEALIKTVRLVD